MICARHRRACLAIQPAAGPTWSCAYSEKRRWYPCIFPAWLVRPSTYIEPGIVCALASCVRTVGAVLKDMEFLLGAGAQAVQFDHVLVGHNLILLGCQKQDSSAGWNLGDGLERRPYFATQKGEIAQDGQHGRNQLGNTQECVFHDQDTHGLGITSGQVDGDSAADALAICNHWRACELGVLADPIQGSLCIDAKSWLRRLARRKAVSAVGQHNDVAAEAVKELLCNRQTMAHVACIGMEHQDGGSLFAFVVVRHGIYMQLDTIRGHETVLCERQFVQGR